MKTKQCRICNKRKLLTEFYKSKQHTDKHDSRCKICQRQYTKQWLENNPEKAELYNARKNQAQKDNGYQRTWISRNEKRWKEYYRQWYQNNKQHQNENCRKYRERQKNEQGE